MTTNNTIKNNYIQTQNDYNAFSAIENWDVDVYVMLSEFIDNSIAQWDFITFGNSVPKTLKIKINMDHDKNILTYSDNAGGVTHFPDKKEESGKKRLTKEEEINEIFTFYNTSLSIGLNKYHVGMKQAMYFLGKSWEFISPFPNIENSKSYKISASIKEKPNNDTGDIKLDINPLDKKYSGITVKIYDFTKQQLDRLFDHNAINIKKFNSDKLKNMIIPLITEKYKYIILNQDISIEISSTLKNNTKSQKIEKNTIFKYCIETNNLQNTTKYPISGWKKTFDIVIEKSKKMREDFLKLDNTDIETVDLYKKVPKNVFLEKLHNRESLEETFLFKNGVKIKIGIIDFTNPFITAQKFQGLTYFQHNRAITIRPYKSTPLFGGGRGGAAYRIFAEAFIPDTVMQPDQNKKGFSDYKTKRKIKENISKIIISTKLVEISQFLINFEKLTTGEKKEKKKKIVNSKQLFQSYVSPHEKYVWNLKNNKFSILDDDGKILEEKNTEICADEKSKYMQKETEDTIIWNTNNFLKKLNLTKTVHEKATVFVASIIYKQIFNSISDLIRENWQNPEMDSRIFTNKVHDILDEKLGENGEKIW